MLRRLGAISNWLGTLGLAEGAKLCCGGARGSGLASFAE